MKHNYAYFMLLLLLLLGGAAGAQENVASPAKISGLILDEKQLPVEYATVGLFKEQDSSLVKTAITESNGAFSFPAVGAGKYFIRVSVMGSAPFKAKSFTIDAGRELLDLGKINIRNEGTALNVVTIVAQKPLIERKADKLVMNVENSSVAIGSTALEVLQKAPGVNVDQNDKISMQGKQGVLIMLDGKSTYMSNADVVNLLRNMTSAQIESIELITNPSSKYDASGNAGIINIKTKKNKNGGTNGSISSSAAFGNVTRANGGLNLNHRSQKLNIFGNYYYGNYKNNNLLNIDRISGIQQDTYFTQSSLSFRKRQNNNFKAGADFFLNSKNTLGILLSGYDNSGKETTASNTLIGRSFSQTDSLLNASSSDKDHYHGLSYNLNYKSVLDSAGAEISADADYANYIGNDIAVYENKYSYTNGQLIRPLNIMRNATPTSTRIKALKADYTGKIGAHIKLEAGLKSSWVKTDNDLRAEQWANNGWENDVNRSNRFIYDENINALYGNVSRQFNKTTVQLGLRLEQTNSKGNLITKNNVVERSYLDFFPTLFIQHSLSDNNQFGFSYSRRIERPGYDALNPFVYYLDQYTYNQGNPFLKPQYTHSFELSYTLLQKYLVSFNYSRDNDVIMQVLLPNDNQKALYQTNENIAKNITIGMNVSLPFKLAKWWSLNQNINIFHIASDAPGLGGRDLKTAKSSYQLRMQNAFKLPEGITAELNASYDSPVDYATIRAQESYYVDMGISKAMFKKKASLKLAMSDVFNTNKTRITSAYPGLSYKLYQKNDTQIGKISFSYRFGKNEIKPARKRSTGTEDEQSRVKN